MQPEQLFGVCMLALDAHPVLAELTSEAVIWQLVYEVFPRDTTQLSLSIAEQPELKLAGLLTVTKVAMASESVMSGVFPLLNPSMIVWI
jgi:hypothetical protein